jgi:predicted nucleic acid-binding protein
MIGAERNNQSVVEFIEAILRTHGPLDLSLSPVTVAELVHGVYRARTPSASQRRREFIVSMRVSQATGWVVCK